uniref:Uncharacterized protein n=1 Tax=Triticum urartu TaxID=4572 RepID=A0A8R7P718_TRIUA
MRTGGCSRRSARGCPPARTGRVTSSSSCNLKSSSKLVSASVLTIHGLHSYLCVDPILGPWSLNDVSAIYICRLYIKQASSGITFADEDDPEPEWAEYKIKKPTCSP